MTPHQVESRHSPTTPNAKPAPSASSPEVRLRMQGVRRCHTRPEIELRSLLHRAGLRFRVNCRAAPGVPFRPDIVFTRVKTAVFVDGCFWHGCPIHGHIPKSHSDWWQAKFLRTRTRDALAARNLELEGWLVVRVWEHEDPALAASRIVSQVQSRMHQFAPR